VRWWCSERIDLGDRIMFGTGTSVTCRWVTLRVAWGVAIALLALPAARAHEKHKTSPPAEIDSTAQASDGVPDVAPASSELPFEQAGSQSSSADAHEGLHEHAPRGVPRLLAWFGKFHPLLTHFPIALLIAAALGEILLMRRPGMFFEHAVRFCVGFGAVAAMAAALLGWFFGGFQLNDDEWLMTAHRWTGTATAFWAVLLLVVSERTLAGTAPRRSFRFALFAGAGLVAASGFLGGLLIYGLDHYAW
jgi:uncharacterized membrane protein